MSKLVDDPIDAEPFLPLLMPALERAADAMSDPEARVVAENAAAQLNRLNKLCQEIKAGSQAADRSVVLAALKSKLPAAVVSAENEVTVGHVADMCLSLMGKLAYF